MKTVAIVGGSLAGTQAAQAMRRADFDGRLVMIGDEDHFPYDRPPLSKNYLTDDEVDEQRLRLRPTLDPEALGIEWRLGRTAVSFDLSDRVVGLDDGEAITVDGLIVACGARPRRLPGADNQPDGVFELRTLDDARALRAALAGGPKRVLVCGAGFIGAEVAASARTLGLDVTLVDVASVPLDRVLDRDAGRAVADLHQQHGVDLRLETGVSGFETTGGSGRVAAVALSDGSEVEADVVVIGIGVTPNTEWLEDSDLTVDNGLVVDNHCQAGPGVFGAGDVARWPNRRFGGRLMRVEQWDNAVDMGMYVGRRMANSLNGDGDGDGETEANTDDIEANAGDADVADPPFEPVPWFWSDQYDRKIQLAGLVDEHREVVQGSFEEQRFVQLYADGAGRLTGALCWNRPRQAIKARQLIAADETLDAAREQLA